MLECSCHIISYLADVMNALRQSSGQGTSALLMEGEEKAMEVDSDWVEELAVEEDDSQAEDSVRSYPFKLYIDLNRKCSGIVRWQLLQKTNSVQIYIKCNLISLVFSVKTEP